MGNRGSRGKGYESPRQECPQCGRSIAVSARADASGYVRYRRHNGGDGQECPMSGFSGLVRR